MAVYVLDKPSICVMSDVFVAKPCLICRRKEGKLSNLWENYSGFESTEVPPHIIAHCQDERRLDLYSV